MLMALNISNHNGMLSTDHFLDLKSIQDCFTQQISFDRNFTFLYHVLIVKEPVPPYNVRNRCTGLFCCNLINT